MTTIHNLGFPRIGKKRELKKALENYWQGKISETELQQSASELRQLHWHQQRKLDWLPVGDFSLYDQVLDMSYLLGNIPKRFKQHENNSSEKTLDQYFSVARGGSTDQDTSCSCSSSQTLNAGEMTKWFDTNYHYIVPEFDTETKFLLNADILLAQIEEAKSQGHNIKPVIIGPVTYLWLGKSKDGSEKLELLDDLLSVYSELLHILGNLDIEWLQIDEPVLVTELSQEWQHALRVAYYQLQNAPVKILLTTYFGQLQENLQLVCELPVNGLHVDAVNNHAEVIKLVDWLPSHKILSLGVINGRNIWKADLNETLNWLEPIHKRLNDRLWLAPSCSLLHVPVDLNSENKLTDEISCWLAFAVQKLEELDILENALEQGRESVIALLSDNKKAIQSRQGSENVHNKTVQDRIASITEGMSYRQSPYKQRAEKQSQCYKLPLYPTTTIGSFPQTKQIRETRSHYRLGKLPKKDYQQTMKAEIAHSVQEQEILGLDVLVHGEAERNDMVEYFGEQLTGYAFTQFGWVQSYGSRCVKPPIIYGDISRPEAMTVEWIQYAQSLTYKPMKGMLTGPVTILNWSFVRDDQARSETCLQIALAIRDEVLDLEKSGIGIIQIDEAALREGLPLRKNQWQSYLNWAIKSFRITANGVRDETQIHTHMCYSEFNDIIQSIAEMDADVITIETSRSDMELLDVFDEFQYPNEIGPGVYDIHSPVIPSVDSMVELMQKATQRIPAQRLWVNPDCGLKTRHWDEVKPALLNMIEASKILRNDYNLV